MQRNSLTIKIVQSLLVFILTVATITSLLPEKNVSFANATGKIADSVTTTKVLPYTSQDSTDFGITEFGIEIPAIGLKHEIAYSIDPRNKDVYLPVLEEYVAHGMFTSLPSTEPGRVYLFAHSKVASEGVTPYGGYFSHLHELKNGDSVVVRYNGKQYTYVMRERIIVEPTETSVYTGNSKKAEVALQTCYPPGTTDMRLIVFAELVSVK